MRGTNKYPRLVEFQNSRLRIEDFDSWHIDFITVGSLEFASTHADRWVTPAGEIITIGEMIKRIYSQCNPEVELILYVTDFNPSSAKCMQLKKKFEYRLSLGEKYYDKAHRLKQGYNLEAIDDVKVLHSLKQVMELTYDTRERKPTPLGVG